MFGFLDDIFKSPEGKALLAGAAIAGTGGAAAPVVGDAFMPAALGADGLLATPAATGGLLGVGGGADAWGQLKSMGSAAGEYAKPAAYGLQAASSAQNLFANHKPATPASPIMPTQSGELSSLYGQLQQGQQSQMQAEEQKRAQRRAMYQGSM